eukprot:CAMPEP_0201721852 /NCGR_PEP_ID=MMETSP0593-20130828/6409_1 /ASSEMBLY_ACC=CAM_ASM_000672 /TAXON_ID=267983 /ORGANISM="Skeletonema japonicum, Strain CCMP2506" /LENGTH=407 /DNA_ID=CAMNT_0048212729 /DNA_START=60 /DNA_END=1283 /DNA_ORIENTATION=+
MTTNRRSRGRQSALKTAAASVLGVAVYSIFSDQTYLHNGRRFLTSELEHDMEIMTVVPAAPLSMPAPTAVVIIADDADNAVEDMSYLISSHSTLLPWAQYNLVDIHEGPVQSPDATNMFWHIPKAGGTTAKQLYQCMGKTLTIRIGIDPRHGHDQTDEIVVFPPIAGKDWNTVNVDTTIRPGIVRAKKMGLVQSHTADLIFTMEPAFAGEQLFDPKNKGRIMALFRNPVDRLVSKFYYLQTATWERTYKPEWKEMSIVDWAELPSEDENFMVRKLSGKRFSEPVNEMDLILAKEFLRQRVVVGLMGEMTESFRRFNIAMNVDVHDERNNRCIQEYFGNKDTGSVVKNSNKHPKVVEGSEEWHALAKKNHLDMILYAYAERLFEEQKEIVDSYTAQHLEDEREESVEV